MPLSSLMLAGYIFGTYLIVSLANLTDIKVGFGVRPIWVDRLWRPQCIVFPPCLVIIFLLGICLEALFLHYTRNYTSTKCMFCLCVVFNENKELLGMKGRPHTVGGWQLWGVVDNLVYVWRADNLMHGSVEEHMHAPISQRFSIRADSKWLTGQSIDVCILIFKSGPIRDGLGGDSPDLLSRLTKQQCLAPVLLECGLGETGLRSSTHWGLSRWRREAHPTVFSHTCFTLA